jgi:peptidoglycan/xylan/chitin deacetylase (PgdA/CDA1 family)
VGIRVSAGQEHTFADFLAVGWLRRPMWPFTRGVRGSARTHLQNLIAKPGVRAARKAAALSRMHLGWLPRRLMADLAKVAVGPRWAATALLAAAAICLTACGNAGTGSTASLPDIRSRVVVSLTFDDGTESQYALGFRHGLLPRGVHGTFYVTTGNTGVNPGAMSWSQLSYLYQRGNDIGGHTVHHIDLASSSNSLARKAAEICGSYQDLARHGLHPVSFAYPYGAYNAADEHMAARCGFRTARQAGGIDDHGPGAGPIYAETMPAYNPYAIRTVYNSTKAAPLVVANLQRAVTAAARHGGGWAVLVFHEICSVSYDPAGYGYCTQSWGSIELDAFDAFLEWLAHPGQPGGAPAGTIVRTVRQVTGRT